MTSGRVSKFHQQSYWFGPWMEVVPGGSRATAGVVRAFHRVALFAVEIDAVAARVVEDAVHDHMHPALFAAAHRCWKSASVPSKGSIFGVIRRIVPVVGALQRWGSGRCRSRRGTPNRGAFSSMPFRSPPK